MRKYYNPKPLLHMRDIDGEIPGFFLCFMNRTAGKTFNFCKEFIEDWRDNGHMTMMLYRDIDECGNGYNEFQKVLNKYPHLGKEMSTEPIGRFYHRMLLDGKTFGYCVSLKRPNKFKKHAPSDMHLIYNVYMDEATSEDGDYIPNEIANLQSLLLTIARGDGELSRYVRVVLTGNPVNIMNPYYIFFDLHKRLNHNTKKIRGKGWVGYFGISDSAQEAIRDNPTFKVFHDKKTKQMSYAMNGDFLVDDSTFIEPPPKSGFKYWCTIVYDGKSYGCRYYWQTGTVYFTEKYDKNFKEIYVFKDSDHNDTRRLLAKGSAIHKGWKEAYNLGMMKYDSFDTKMVVYDILGVNVFG